MVSAERIEGLTEADEITGDELGPLVYQLVEGVLAVRPRLAPDDRPCLIVDGRAIQRHVLAVALHGQLLQIGRKALEILLVGEDADRLRPEEVVVPDAEEPHENGQIARKWGGAKVLVHSVEATEHGAKVVWTDGEHRRQADG